jgi:membrane-associated protein
LNRENGGGVRPVCRQQREDGHFVTGYIAQLTGIVSAHAGLAYLIVFLAALLEAVPVLGSVIPGSTIILALSALIGDGELKFLPLMLAAIAGAVIGDGSAFWIGHRSQREILNAWPMARYPGVVAQSEAFFNRYGTLAVLFARFVAPIRAFVPLTAGALGMPPRRFYGVNIAAIVMWASAHILPGMAAASVFERYGPAIRHYWFPVVLGAGLIAGLAIWWIRRRRGVNLPVKRQRS